VANVDSGRLQMQDAARVGARDHWSAGAADGVDLPLPELARHLWMGSGVGAARAATEPLVVELDEIGERRQHGPHVLLGALHVAQMARVLDGDPIRQPRAR